MLSDSVTVISEHARVIFGILLFMGLSQFLVSRALRIIFGEVLTTTEYLTLGLTGWILPASLLSILWNWLGYVPALTILAILFGVLTFSPRFMLRTHPGPVSKRTVFALLMLLSVSILLRLTFVSKALLPSYFDSAQHYLLIKDILQTNSQVPVPLASYYHLGFHVLTAFITVTLQTDIAETMLILGQIILGGMPIALFFLIRHETQLNMAGIFTILLAAVGWYMPAHAVNWGKYPALMSLGTVPFVFSLAYLLARHKSELTQNRQRLLYILLGLSVFVSAFAHTRTAVIFVMGVLVGIATVYSKRLSTPKSNLTALIILLILAVEIYFIQKQSLLAQVFDPYFQSGVWVSVLVVLLTFLAWKNYPQLTLTCILFSCLLLGGLFIPVWVPGYGDMVLLDRPYVQMILFLPLSLLGGLGMAGAMQFLLYRSSKVPPLPNALSLMLCGLIVFHAFTVFDFYPSDCCVIVGRDDLLAMDWMESHIPNTARIGISVTTLDVLPTRDLEGYSGSDAGIWITPLINRVTIGLSSNSDFDQVNIHDRLCQSQINYLYVGEIGQTFDDQSLSVHPEWYRVLLRMPQARVYEVVGCTI